jgi:precorrin-6B methylase 2
MNQHTSTRHRSDSPPDRAHYGTWIRVHRIAVFATATVACLAGCGVAPWPWLLAPALAALPLGYITTVIALSAWHFSDRGGHVQHRVHALLASALELAPHERVLDVGCGSGALAVTLAKAQPRCHITGVDLWGRNWRYSQQQAQTNARIEAVDQHTTFARHSASALPFDSEFDALTSCLTFHEVRDGGTGRAATDATVAALKALRPTGRFVILDLFGSPQHYPSVQHVIDAIERAGATVHSAVSLRELVPLSFPLGMRQVLGDAVVITGHRLVDAATGACDSGPMT